LARPSLTRLARVPLGIVFTARPPKLAIETFLSLRNFQFRIENDNMVIVDGKRPAPPEAAAPFLAGGGEMGARIRAFDWASTSLGEWRAPTII
jgi:hypothetical protein